MGHDAPQWVIVSFAMCIVFIGWQPLLQLPRNALLPIVCIGVGAYGELIGRQLAESVLTPCRNGEAWQIASLDEVEEGGGEECVYLFEIIGPQLYVRQAVYKPLILPSYQSFVYWDKRGSWQKCGTFTYKPYSLGCMDSVYGSQAARFLLIIQEKTLCL